MQVWKKRGGHYRQYCKIEWIVIQVECLIEPELILMVVLMKSTYKEMVRWFHILPVRLSYQM
jgi:hypothetical protein